MMQKTASYNALELIRHNPGKIAIQTWYFTVCALTRLTPFRVYFELCGQLSPLHSPQYVAYDRGWLLSAVSWAASYFSLMIANFQHAQVFSLSLTLFRTVKKGLCSLLFSVSSVVYSLSQAWGSGLRDYVPSCVVIQIDSTLAYSNRDALRRSYDAGN